MQVQVTVKKISNGGADVTITLNGNPYIVTLSENDIDEFLAGSVNDRKEIIGTAICNKKGVTKELAKTLEFKNNSKKIFDILAKKLSHLNEMTTSASSGSFETPFGLMRGDMKKLEDLKENKKMKQQITLSEIEKIVIKTLIREEVYSEKPTEPKGKEISTKNLKQPTAYNSNAAKSTTKSVEKSGKEHKTDVTSRTKKVNDNLKDNLKDKKVANPNKDTTHNDDTRIESHQNGQEDITYDKISDEKKAKNKELYLNKKDSDKNPNASKTNVGEKLIDDAKKRKQSKDDSEVRKAKVFGKDVEFAPESKNKGKKGEGKSLAFENSIKRLTFKEAFKSEKEMISKIPKKYKNHLTVLEMFDGIDKYKVRWEGSDNKGTAVILEHHNPIMESIKYDEFMKLAEYDTKESNSFTSKESEDSVFRTLMNEARGIK